MTQPVVSVVIPAYNQGPFLGAAIESVIAQRFQEWELIVVDDGSHDDTAQVAQSFADSRVHYVYQKNAGLPAARNTGIQHAQGEFLAFLDADDLFLPDKLGEHVAHMQREPEIGLSYASRIEVDAQGRPSWFLSAPPEVALEDLVLGFPFTINDLLVRRACVEQVGGFDESFRLHSEDRDFYVRLALEGCQFGFLKRFVAHRRLHEARVFSRIPERIETMGRALETAFGDPRCPTDVLALRDKAYAQIYLTWGCQELVQAAGDAEITALGQKHLQQALSLDNNLLGVEGRSFLNYLVWFGVRDGGDHVQPLERIFENLPDTLAHLRRQHDWALARGYLLRGGRETIWGRLEQGRVLFAQALTLNGRPDHSLLVTLADQLSNYGQEYGEEASRTALTNLNRELKPVATEDQLRWLNGHIAINQAFNEYYRGQFGRVPGNVFRAVVSDPSHLRDRGVIAILARSLVGMVAQ